MRLTNGWTGIVRAFVLNAMRTISFVTVEVETQASRVHALIAQRLVECGLELHPEKSQVVYCKDVNRRSDYPVIQFDFLGYTFRPRKSTDRYGRCYVNFLPAVGDKAAKAMRPPDAPLGHSSTCDKITWRHCPDVQSYFAGLDQLLRSVLPLGFARRVPLSRPSSSTVGATEIQTTAPAPASSRAVAPTHYEGAPPSVCTLAPLTVSGWTIRAG